MGLHAHPHGHAHDHGHGHGAESSADRGGDRRRLKWVLALVLFYMIAEFVGGLWTGSLALLADAGHMLSDAAALGLALLALWFSERPANPRFSYGYHRSEILAALANGMTILILVGFLIAEAIDRLETPTEVLGPGMTLIAIGGLLVNLAGLKVLHGGRGGSLNLEGAFLHVLADTLGSVGAIAAGALVWAFDWTWADAVVTLAISLLLIFSTWGLLKETLGILMEGTPAHLDPGEIGGAIQAVEGVRSVHDLHVWTITNGRVALSAHVATSETPPASDLLERLRKDLKDRFRIDHTTIQIEPPDFEDCIDCAAENGTKRAPTS